MNPTIRDADFSFEEAAKEREKRRRYEADPRRQKLVSPDPRRKRLPPWPGFPGSAAKEAEPLPPAWEPTFDPKSGKLIALRQLRPLPRTEDLKFENLNRRFRCVVEGDPISIGGFHVEHGTKIECRYSTALAIHGNRGRIIEEFSE